VGATTRFCMLAGVIEQVQISTFDIGRILTASVFTRGQAGGGLDVEVSARCVACVGGYYGDHSVWSGCPDSSAAGRTVQSGFGDLMNTLVQPRHAKLGLIGREQNWTLAAYESHQHKDALSNIVAAAVRRSIGAGLDGVNDRRRYQSSR
jgi:hypothetical protein